MNLSRISVAAAATPRATVAAKSGVDIVLWVSWKGTASRSYVMQVWTSWSHTKASHLHGSVSVSMCALGQDWSLSRLERVRRW